MKIDPIVMFINQVKVTKSTDGSTTDWEDACGGHSTLYDAMACQDRQEQIIRGNFSCTEGIPSKVAVAQGLHQSAKLILGHECRIIKRTVTIENEVIEKEEAHEAPNT